MQNKIGVARSREVNRKELVMLDAENLMVHLSLLESPNGQLRSASWKRDSGVYSRVIQTRRVVMAQSEKIIV